MWFACLCCGVFVWLCHRLQVGVAVRLCLLLAMVCYVSVICLLVWRNAGVVRFRACMFVSTAKRVPLS